MPLAPGTADPERSRKVGARKAARLIGVVAVAFVSQASGADAQWTPAGEISANYSAIVGDDSMPKGLHLSAAWYWTQWFGLAGEVGWNGRQETLGGAPFIVEYDATVTTLAGGARLVPWSSERVMLLVEVLVGHYRDNHHLQELDPDPFSPFPFDIDLKASSLAVQTGGGVRLWLNRRVGVQALLHYRRTLSRSADGFRLRNRSEVRVGAGLAVGF